ncbi:hypothetical protein PIECOFPK_01615 [Mycovorax composti]|jgi:hypothetical protein|uniref:Uncharacterized protein n=1 Tax=Mycovorax composti TaxID=2962693 RepID=A0ABZ2EKD4_9BACT
MFARKQAEIGIRKIKFGKEWQAKHKKLGID